MGAWMKRIHSIPHLSSRKYDDNEIFQFIVQYKIDHDGVSPTMREIKESMGVSSTSVVNYILDRLEYSGRIKRPANGTSTRSIQIIGGKWTFGEGEDHAV